MLLDFKKNLWQLNDGVCVTKDLFNLVTFIDCGKNIFHDSSAGRFTRVILKADNSSLVILALTPPPHPPRCTLLAFGRRALLRLHRHLVSHAARGDAVGRRYQLDGQKLRHLRENDLLPRHFKLLNSLLTVYENTATFYVI